MRRRLPGLLLAGTLSFAGAGALAQAEAERRLDAAIERLRSALGPEARLEIGRRQVDPVTGRATLLDVTLAEGRQRLAIPELRLADVGETRIGRAELLRTTYREVDGGTGEVARILVTGLPVPVPGKSLDLGNLSFDALEVEALRVDDPGKGMLRLAWLEARDWRPGAIGSGSLEGFHFLDAAADPQRLRLGRVALEAVAFPPPGADFDPRAFRAARLSVEDAELRDPGHAVALAIGRVALQDWLPGRPVALAVESLQLASPAGAYGAMEMRLGRLDLAGMDAARTLEAVVEGVQVPDPLPGTPQRLLLEAVEADWEGQPVFALGRVLSEASLEGGVLRGGMTAEGLRLTAPPGQADWLGALGYAHVAGGLELRGSAPRAGGRLELAPFRLAWEEAATLTLGAQLDGVPGAPPEGTPLDPDATALKLLGARLAGLNLTLQDHGLLGRVLGQQAREQRVPEARLREQWAQMALAIPVPGAAPPPARGRAAPPAGKGAADGDPFAPMRQALAAFIRQPGTLEVTLRPAKPLAIVELGDLGGNPAEAVQRLGLSVMAR